MLCVCVYVCVCACVNRYGRYHRGARVNGGKPKRCPSIIKYTGRRPQPDGKERSGRGRTRWGGVFPSTPSENTFFMTLLGGNRARYHTTPHAHCIRHIHPSINTHSHTHITCVLYIHIYTHYSTHTRTNAYIIRSHLDPLYYHGVYIPRMAKSRPITATEQ